MSSGLVFDLQGFSLHDGPGCRTLVFLSGCPLRCRWCSNPEGLLPRPRLMVVEDRCRGRRGCARACPHDAVGFDADHGGAPRFDRSRCESCETLDCVAACTSQALRVAGRALSVDELERILRRDSAYWGAGGGVTFGGGEPLFQPRFLLEALARCRSLSLHTAVETSGHAEPDALLAALDHLDWLLFDLKHLDDDAHRAGTGVGNRLILDNLERVVRSGWRGRLVPRIPVVPGFNDGSDNLDATAALLHELGLPEVHLLPLHHLGASKYRRLGMAYPAEGIEVPDPADLRAAAARFEAAGLRCWVGHETPF